MKKWLFKSWVAAATLCASSVAMASPCDSVLSLYSNGSWPDAPQYHPECFGASSQASAVAISQTSFVQISAISTALSNRFLLAPPTKIAGLASGIAAATPGKAWNVWANLNDGRSEQEYFRPLAASNIRITTDSLNTVLGGDYALSPTLAAGVSVAFDRASGESHANGAKQNDLLNKGYMVAPYLGMSLRKDLALDASLGWGQGELSQTGNVTADADRWFAGVNLNYANWFGNTQLTGRLGWYHGEEDYDNAKANGATLSGTAAKNKLDQWRLGVQVGWWMNGVMPYVGLGYSSERRSTSLSGASDPIGKNAWKLSLGANFLSLASGMTGGIAYEQEWRDKQDDYRLIANIGIRF